MRAIGTVMWRELGAFFNTPMGYVFMVFFLLLSCGLYVVLHLFVDAVAEMRGYFFLLPFLLAVFTPAVTMRLWAEERKLGTLELLLTFPVRTAQAVVGKFLAAWVFLAATLACTLHLPLALWLLRPENAPGPDWGPVLGGYLGALVLGMVYLAAGAFASSLARDQIIAYVIGLALNAVLFLISHPVIIAVFRELHPDLAAHIQRFGIYYHFESIARGVVDTRDILYAVSLCAFFLFLNVLALSRRRLGALAAAGLVLGLAVVLLVNPLGDRLFARGDLTAEGRYSLSPGFRHILGRLEDPLQLTYYVSEKVPLEFERRKRDILDRLGEIQLAAGRDAQGRPRILLNVVDPGANPRLLRRLKQECPAIETQAPSLEKDKISFSFFYSGLQLLYRDKPVLRFPQIFAPEDLEYKIGSGVVSLTLAERPIIGMHMPAPAPGSGPRGAPQTSGYEWIIQEPAFESLFDRRRVELTESSPIPKGCRLLILARPKLTARARWEVLRYLAEGGNVFLLASPQHIDWNAHTLTREQTGLEDYLAPLGLTLKSGFIYDQNNVALPVSVRRADGSETTEQRAFPYYVQILPSNLDPSNPVTRFLPPLTVPLASEIALDADRARERGLEAQVLARSSDQSWTVSINAFDPGKIAPPPERFDPPKAVLVTLSGPFPFPFAGQPAPPWEGTAPPAGNDAPAPPLHPQPGQLYVFSCPDGLHSHFFEKEDMREKFIGNVRLLYNIMERFLSPDLVQISAKTYETRTIRKLDARGQDVQRNLWKAGLVAGPPLLIVLFALARHLWRRRTQLAYERRFAGSTGPSSFSP